MLLVTLALKTLLSISRNRMDQITSNRQIDNHLNEDIINASTHLRNSIFPLKSLIVLTLRSLM